MSDENPKECVISNTIDDLTTADLAVSNMDVVVLLGDKWNRLVDAYQKARDRRITQEQAVAIIRAWIDTGGPMIDQDGDKFVVAEHIDDAVNRARDIGSTLHDEWRGLVTAYGAQPSLSELDLAALGIENVEAP